MRPWFRRIPFESSITLDTAQSEWSLFSFDQLPDTSDDTPLTDLARADGGDPDEDVVVNTDAGQAHASGEVQDEDIATDADAEQMEPAPAMTITPPATSTTLPQADDSAYASPNQDQILQDLEGEAAWMRSKHTLRFFREVHKTGRLADLIVHWHQLENALGFPETVCCLPDNPSFEKFPNAAQTPRDALPSQKRPDVLRVFFKNGHKYLKDYGLKASTLGSDIGQWWDELVSAGDFTAVCVGGPTGISTLVVLMSWWSKLLKGYPDAKLADFHRVLEDIDNTMVAAVLDVRGQPSVSGPPSARGAKRAVLEEPLSRKRLCSGRA